MQGQQSSKCMLLFPFPILIALSYSFEIIGFWLLYSGQYVCLLDHVVLLEVEGCGQGTLIRIVWVHSIVY
jgi:hypothetical protein